MFNTAFLSVCFRELMERNIRLSMGCACETLSLPEHEEPVPCYEEHHNTQVTKIAIRTSRSVRNEMARPQKAGLSCLPHF